MRPLAWTGL